MAHLQPADVPADASSQTNSREWKTLLSAVMSTTSVAELCYAVTEWLDWNARAARRNCRD
jgi:hypothetical protein